jgi:hypothetical protein
MGLLPLAVIVLSGAPSPQLTWSVTSPSGVARLSQTGLTDDACALECEVGGRSAWKAQVCLGRRTDFAFVSKDCGSTVMLFEYPLKTGTPEETSVAVSMSGGTAPRAFKLGELGAPSRGEGKRVRWLAGVVEEPGVKPHLNADETAVEFTTFDGQVRTVRFGNPDDFVPRRAGSPAQPVVMYQFTDADGATQFVVGLENVPQKFRKRARPVESEVDTVKGVKLPPRFDRPPSRADEESLQRLQADYQKLLNPPPRPPEPPKDPNDPTQCHIFGLPGPACQAVQAAERQRGFRR